MFKQFSLNTVYRLVGFIIGFFLSVIIARKLGSDEYGIFAIFLTIGGLISGIGMFGFPDYIIKNISITRSINNKILFVFLNSLFVILILILLFHIFENNIYCIFNIETVQIESNLYFIGYIVFVTLNVFLRSIFEGFHNSQNGYLIKEVFGRLFKLLPFLILKITLKNVFTIFFLAEFLVFIIFIGLIYYKFDIDIDKKKRLLSKKDIKKIYQYTMPLFATSLVLIFNGQIIKLLLGSFEAAKYVGYYDISLNFASLMIIGLNIQNTVLKPYFSKFFQEVNLHGVQKYYSQSSKILTLISLPIGLLFLGFPKLFLMFYGSGFYEAKIILQLVIISSIINISTGSNYPILVMSKISYKEFNANILNFASVILLGTIFIYAFGYIGAGLILILSQTIVNVYRIIVLNKEYGLKPFHNMLSTYSLLFTSVVIIMLLSNVMSNSIMYLVPILLFIILTTCYLFIKIEFHSGEIKEYYFMLKEKILLK